MQNYFKDASFEITYPNCQKKISIKSSDINLSIVCPYCSQNIQLKDHGFNNAIDKANNLLNDFPK